MVTHEEERILGDSDVPQIMGYWAPSFPKILGPLTCARTQHEE